MNEINAANAVNTVNASPATIVIKENVTDDAEFNHALDDIASGGSAVKRGFQIAVRKALEEILNRKKTYKINTLYRKLEALESPHYRKLLLKNLAAWVGYVDIELDSHGQMRYYRKPEKGAPIKYTKERGKKGWKIEAKSLENCMEVYKKYFNAVHFASIKIEDRIENKEFIDKCIGWAKKAQDIANDARGLIEDPIWEKIPPEYQRILRHMAEISDM